MSIIDFRLRVPYKSGEKFITPQNSWAERIGFTTPESVKQTSMELLLKELDEAGIDKGVVHARIDGLLPEIKNEDVASLVQEYPGKFYGLAVIDPTKPAEIKGIFEEYIETGKLVGITIEPTMDKIVENHFSLDDPRCYIAYRQADKYRVPVLLCYGGGGIPKNGADSVNALRKILDDFPNVNFVLGHGGWPYTNEMIQLAYFHRNLYLSPDLYSTNFPGADDYFVAARHVLQDQIIFGTAYPFVPVGDVIDKYRKELTDPVIFEKVTYRNAAKLIGIEK
jgi:hypothetical protein